MSFLKFEHENGYPSFRTEIAQVLHERYNVGLQKAEELVWNDFIGEKITEDIEWSQHMGPNYWAKFILANCKDALPKRTGRLVPQY
ncbi:hypothetical protein [Bacillus subtilis]